MKKKHLTFFLRSFLTELSGQGSVESGGLRAAELAFVISELAFGIERLEVNDDIQSCFLGFNDPMQEARAGRELTLALNVVFVHWIICLN